MDGGAWWATVHGVAKSRTRLSNFTSLHFTSRNTGGASGKEPACRCRRHKRYRFSPQFGKIQWRRAWQPTPVFLPGESAGRGVLVGYSSQSCKELDTKEASYHTHAQARNTARGNRKAIGRMIVFQSERKCLTYSNPYMEVGHFTSSLGSLTLRAVKHRMKSPVSQTFEIGILL